MPTTKQTLYTVRNGGAWITLNRPERRNALSPTLIAETYDHLLAANEDDNVRCVVITGAPQAFCAGADLKANVVRRRVAATCLIHSYLHRFRTTPSP
ncbi:MAG: enoyl-CoA hydratase/isomerase family protein [Planctomycetaceae bacterium]